MKFVTKIFQFFQQPECMFENSISGNKLLCIIHTVEHNYFSVSSIVGIQLHWVQLHVLALYVGHRHVVL